MRPWSSSICDRNSSMVFLYFRLSKAGILGSAYEKTEIPFKYTKGVVVLYQSCLFGVEAFRVFPCCCLMGQPSRFWKSVLAAAPQHRGDRRFQIHLVPHGNVDGGDVVPGAYRRTYHFTFIHHRRRCSPLGIQGVIATNQPRLGTANSRHFCDQTQVAGQTESSGVCQPLSVYQDNIRGYLQSLKGIDSGWDLSKRKVTGDVRDGRPRSTDPDLCDLHLRPPEHHYRAQHPTLCIRRGDVHPCNVLEFPGDCIHVGDLACQRKLKRFCLFQTSGPWICGGELHHASISA